MASRVNKSCDQCRARKVRCIPIDEAKRLPPQWKRRSYVIIASNEAKLATLVFTGGDFGQKIAPSSTSDVDSSELYIDCILRDGPQNQSLTDETGYIKTSDNQGNPSSTLVQAFGDANTDWWISIVPSSTLAFFSDPRVNQLTEKTGSQRLKSLIQQIDGMIGERIRGTSSTWPKIHFTKPLQQVTISKQIADRYVDAYFINTHPMYPFLDRGEFTRQLQAFHDSEDDPNNTVFSALYHTVLALGSQFVDGGTYQPGHGVTWDLYQIALGFIADVILPKESLVNLQALTAMSILATNICCIQLEDTLITEAARMALSLRYHKSAHVTIGQLRTFWVVYYMEKQSCFQNRMSSIFSDNDIASPIPPSPPSGLENFDWFLSAIRFARLTSLAYNTLFTVSARRQSNQSYFKAVDRMYQRLEEWRLSVPEEYRPGESLQHLGQLAGLSSKLLIVQTHYLYFSIRVVMERLVIQMSGEHEPRRENSMHNLMWAARTVIELTRYINTEPHVPMFVMGIMPMAGLFILFDFIMQNPLHEETRDNMALLDVAIGYFSHLEYASKGVLLGSIFSEFSQIAREFVRKLQKNVNQGKNPSHVTTETAIVPIFSTETVGSSSTHDDDLTFLTPDMLSTPSNEDAEDNSMLGTDATLIYSSNDALYWPEWDESLGSGDVISVFGLNFS